MTNQHLVTKDKDLRRCLRGVGGLAKRRGGRALHKASFSWGRKKDVGQYCWRSVIYVELQVRVKDTGGFILCALSNNLQSFEKTRSKKR